MGNLLCLLFGGVPLVNRKETQFFPAYLNFPGVWKETLGVTLL